VLSVLIVLHQTNHPTVTYSRFAEPEARPTELL
jgi:hypothetical protein